MNKIDSAIKNEGTIESKAVIKVYGSGDIKLKINDEEITIKSVNEYVTVDCVLNDAYKDDVLKNSDMIWGFIVIKVGENNISFSENISKVEVKVNEAWI